MNDIIAEIDSKHQMDIREEASDQTTVRILGALRYRIVKKLGLDRISGKYKLQNYTIDKNYTISDLRKAFDVGESRNTKLMR